jgi:sorbitol/mannitol transport system permease protein
MDDSSHEEASASEKPRPTKRGSGRLPLLAPSVVALLVWMIVPLALTLWFSLERYNLLDPSSRGFVGLENYRFLLTDPDLWTAVINTLLLVGWVVAISVVAGTLLAVLLDQSFPGRTVARLLAIAPFFVMPTVSAVIWKNLMMHPVNGVLAFVTGSLGLGTIDWLGDLPLTSIVIIVSWQWTPFALLILLTAMQSLDEEQREAAHIDGAGPLAMFFFVVLPHLRRPIAALVMIETIFLLAVFAEIFVTTAGGPGFATTNLAYLIYLRALLDFDVGGASAGGVVAILLANICAFFLVRAIARNLQTEGETV